MNTDQMQGRWHELKGTVREQWGRLTDDDIDAIEGRRELLVGKLLQRYGASREALEQQVKDFERRLQRQVDQRWQADGLGGSRFG